MATSCGIIPFRINDNGQYEFFVGHPGGAYNAKNDYWALLKGGCENEDDSLEETAIREFQEESSYMLTDEDKKHLVYIGFVKQNPRKTVHAFALPIDDIDCEKCHSNLCPDGVTPEIDKYRWMTWNELSKKTHNTHQVFYHKIIQLIMTRSLQVGNELRTDIYNL